MENSSCFWSLPFNRTREWMGERKWRNRGLCLQSIFFNTITWFRSIYMSICKTLISKYYFNVHLDVFSLAIKPLHLSEFTLKYRCTSMYSRHQHLYCAPFQLRTVALASLCLCKMKHCVSAAISYSLMSCRLNSCVCLITQLDLHPGMQPAPC